MAWRDLVLYPFAESLDRDGIRTGALLDFAEIPQERGVDVFRVLDKLEKIGFMAVGGSAKDAESYVQSETKRWGDIIRRVGLEPK